MEERILIVDDEKYILSSLRRLLRKPNREIFCAFTVSQALKILKETGVNLIISDQRMADKRGTDFLKIAKRKWPLSLRIILTGFYELDIAKAAVEDAEAYRFITKPWDDNDLKLTVEHALKKNFLLRENERLLRLTQVQNQKLFTLTQNLEKEIDRRIEKIAESNQLIRERRDSLKITNQLLQRLSRAKTIQGVRKTIKNSPAKILRDLSSPIAIALEKTRLFEIISRGSQQWEATFQAITDPLVIINSSGRIIKLNGAAKRILQKKPPPVLAKVKKTKIPLTSIVEIEGKQYRCTTYPVILEEQKSPIYVQYYQDLSIERELYQKLFQSEKMATIGLLAKSLAHEINNPLGEILALSQIFKKEMNPFHSNYKDIIEIEKAALRAKKIIQNLMGYSKEITPKEKGLVNINELIENTIPLIRFSSAIKHVRIIKDFAEKIKGIEANYNEIQQVIFNLLSNACQAIEKKGEVRIKTENLGEDKISISIIDNGRGIEPEKIKKIFDPFFSTKEKFEGTGLGLSVSLKIVKEYGGDIRVKSKINQGSQFQVILPGGQ